MNVKRESSAPSTYFPRKLLLGLFILTLMAGALGSLPKPLIADTASDVQKKIDDTNAQIAQLEKEIAQYENSLTQIGTQKKTLQSEIDRLDISRKKISADI